MTQSNRISHQEDTIVTIWDIDEARAERIRELLQPLFTSLFPDGHIEMVSSLTTLARHGLLEHVPIVEYQGIYQKIQNPEHLSLEDGLHLLRDLIQ